MSQRKNTFAVGEFFHLYNRGNSKQVIFHDVSDYLRFQQLLFVANGTNSIDFRRIKKDDVFDFERGEQLVSIGAYCLMPNHFHLLVSPLSDDGLSRFIQKVSTGYSMYVNKKYDRTGSLFEGKFKSQHANSDEYLKYLFSYIHLNPIKLIQSDWKEKGIADVSSAIKYLESYKYSSFLDYNAFSKSTYEGKAFVDSKERKEGSIVSKNVFPNYFETPEIFRKEILEWITFNRFAVSDT